MRYGWRTGMSIGTAIAACPMPSNAFANAHPHNPGLPALGSTEAALRQAYGRSLKVVSTDRQSRVFAVPRTLVSSLPALVRFEVSARNRRLYRIEVAMTGLETCHAYEAFIRQRRGKPDDVEWGTKAYELTWKATAHHPATHFWLHAYLHERTECDVTIGPRA